MGSVFLSAVLAGVMIAIGGTAYLSVSNPVVGSLFFTIGLFVICTMKWHLFTGKVCYVFDHDRRYVLTIPMIWLGNLVGTFTAAALERMTRIAPALEERAAAICETKLSDSLPGIFVLAVFCNILIYIGVEGFRSNPHELGKYLSLFFGVCVFILCGFEHCVANMYYFSIAGVWSVRTLGYLAVMTLGNTVGGVLLPVLRRYVPQ